MIKVSVFCTAFFAVAGPALACEMSTDTKRESVVSYVQQGLACLERPPNAYRFDSVVERLFVEKINAERRKRDLAPLLKREELLPAARFQSLDMGVNAFFAHESPDGRGSSERISAFDRTLLAKTTGENIAAFALSECYDEQNRSVSCLDIPGFKFPTPAFVADDLHQKLMDSDGHRANILSEDFTHVSVGVARTDTGYYVTQLFALPIGELSSPLPLEYQTSSTLNVRPSVGTWSLGGYAVVDAEGGRTDLSGSLLQKVSPGDKTLIVIGEKRSEEKRGLKTYIQTEWQNMRGPSFTLKAAKES